MKKALLGVMTLAMAATSFAAGGMGKITVPVSGTITVGTMPTETIKINTESVDLSGEVEVGGAAWNPGNAKIFKDYKVTGQDETLLHAVGQSDVMPGFKAGISRKSEQVYSWTNENANKVAYESVVYDKDGVLVSKGDKYGETMQVAARAYNEDEAGKFSAGNNLRVALTGKADNKLDGQTVTVNGDLHLELVGM